MKLKVGDKIIRLGKVYQVFKVKKSNQVGEKETVIFCRPYFKTKYNQGLVFSIPLDNFAQANIRLPVNKKQLKAFLKSLSSSLVNQPAVNIVNAKEILNSNDWQQIIAILTSLKAEKADKAMNFTKSRQEILNLAINCLIEEVALVNKLSLTQAKKKISKALQQ